MIEVLSTMAGLVAIGGVVLNNYRRIGCFYLWLISNALCAGIHVYTGLWSMAVRDVVFFGLAVHGLWTWQKNQKAKGKNQN